MPYLVGLLLRRGEKKGGERRGSKQLRETHLVVVLVGRLLSLQLRPSLRRGTSTTPASHQLFVSFQVVSSLTDPRAPGRSDE